MRISFNQAICCPGRLTRRQWLANAAAVAGVAGLGSMERMAVLADELRKQHKACILLWMQGGPSQLESFDPKPEHPHGGPTKAISTRVPGISIAEHWPRLAEVMDRVAVIRSVANKEGEHGRASYQLQTGYAPSPALRYPGLGSIAARHLGPSDRELPGVVFVGNDPAPELAGAGFLGIDQEPLVIAQPGEVPPNTRLSVGEDRFRRRLALLTDLQEDFAAQEGQALVTDRLKLVDRAARMVASPRLSAFDLAAEPTAMREAYGLHPFGQGCLLARRLVEAGVTFIKVRSTGRWDTHEGNFSKSPQLAGEVDGPMAQLLRDLAQRGMLDSTLVVWMGEFGRTPKINNRDGGRDHWPASFSVALAGGAVRGGQVVGRTSRDGTEVAERPVTVPNLLASFCHSLGIDPRHEHISPLGRPIKVVEGGEPVAELFSG